MAESYGHQCSMCVDSVAPIDTSSIPIIFDSETLSAAYEIVSENGITGSRSQKAERVREGAGTISGQINLSFTPTSFAFFLEYALGASPSGTTFALAETLPTFVLCIDKKAKVITYTGCTISKMTLKGSKGSPMIKATLDVVATGASVGNAGTFPSLTMPTDPPYMFWDGVLTVQSASRQHSDIEIVIDNACQPNESNSQLPTEYNPTDRIVTVNGTCPFNSTEIALFDQAVAGASGTYVLTNGNYSSTFTFGNLKAKRNHPGVPGKTARVPLQLEMQAFMTGSTRELVVTHDSTG